MIKKETLEKLKKIYPTPESYIKAKRIVESYESQSEYMNDILNMKFYIDRGFDYYSVGTFFGFDGNQIKIKTCDTSWVVTSLEDVYENKKRNMKIDASI